MKKIRIILTSILTFVFFTCSVFADTSTSEDNVEGIDPINLGDLNDTIITTGNNSNVGYIVSDEFVCYSCGLYFKNINGNTLSGANLLASGIGVYFKNGNSWETGSFPGAYESTKGSYALSSLFVVGYIGDTDNITPSSPKENSRAENVINNSSLDTLDNYELAKELTKRLRSIEHREILNLKNDFDYEDKKEQLLSLYDELTFVIGQINEE